MDFHLRIKIDYKMPIQLSFFSKKTITNRKFRIRENMWWVRTLSWLCKTWARNIMSFTSLGVESTHCPFCMGLSNMFENSVLFPIIKMSKKIRRCFDQSCTRLQVFLISYLLFWPALIRQIFLEKKNSAGCLLKTVWLMKICIFRGTQIFKSNYNG